MPGDTNGGRCAEPVLLIFDNWNTAAVKNGGRAPSVDTRGALGKPRSTRWCLVRIETYHFNNGVGAAPGTLGLKDSTGAVLGPYAATGTPSGTVPNANWSADAGTPSPLLDGTYTVGDSSPRTWSGNAQSGTCFARVYVKEYVEP